MEEELRFHLDAETAENVRRGFAPEEARRRAAMHFGGVERVKEEVREARGLGLAEDLALDLRQADWTTLPEYDLLCASPACQGHSPASQPRRRLYHDALRATAFAVIALRGAPDVSLETLEAARLDRRHTPGGLELSAGRTNLFNF